MVRKTRECFQELRRLFLAMTVADTARKDGHMIMGIICRTLLQEHCEEKKFLVQQLTSARSRSVPGEWKQGIPL